MKIKLEELHAKLLKNMISFQIGLLEKNLIDYKTSFAEKTTVTQWTEIQVEDYRILQNEINKQLNKKPNLFKRLFNKKSVVKNKKGGAKSSHKK